jgi:D-tyrosyl-tRNA(Tyr) deacylase
MRVILQRVSSASVEVMGKTTGAIDQGLLVLLGVTHDDNESDIQWLTSKIIQLRIFNDDAGKMNRSIQEIGGGILVVSQFTLFASTRKGNRPGYSKSAPPAAAEKLYHRFIEVLEGKLGKKTQQGRFGEMMDVKLLNKGPVTIFIDSKNKE